VNHGVDELAVDESLQTAQNFTLGELARALTIAGLKDSGRRIRRNVFVWVPSSDGE
jgi:hypothetical protein